MYDSIYDHKNSYGKTYGEHREFLEFNLSQYLTLKDMLKKLKLILFVLHLILKV